MVNEYPYRNIWNAEVIKAGVQRILMLVEVIRGKV